MPTGILVTNAREAWLLSMHFCNQILDGNPSLQMRKLFVSTLENASELIIKQIMINQGCMDVIDLSKGSMRNNPGMQRNYQQSCIAQQLNQFLFSNSSSDFFSIGLSAIIGKISYVFSAKTTSYISGLVSNLKLLKELRNPETHFWIDKKFLTESEFASLLSLVIDLNEIVFSACYNPLEIDLDWGEAHHNENPLFFSYKSTKLTYRDLLVSSRTNQQIAVNLHDTPLIKFDGKKSEMEILNAYFPEIKSLSISFAEFVSRIQLLEDNKLLSTSCDQEAIMITDEDGIDRDVIFYNSLFNFDCSLLSNSTN